MYNNSKKPMTIQIWKQIQNLKKTINELSKEINPLETKIFKLHQEYAWCETCRHYYETDEKYHERNMDKYGICNPCHFCCRYSRLENDYFAYDYMTQEEIEKIKPELDKQKKTEEKEYLMLRMKNIQDQLDKLEENE